MNATATQGVVFLTDANEGRIESRIRLQKQAYLLRWLGYSPFCNLKFSYHYYGPYSRDLSDGLHMAVVGGLLEEEREEFAGGHTRYAYTLTDQGRRACQGSGDLLPSDVMELLRRHEWRTLELGATALFIEEDDGLEPREAFQRALELKPQCRDYQPKAEELLSQLKAMRR